MFLSNKMYFSRDLSEFVIVTRELFERCVGRKIATRRFFPFSDGERSVGREKKRHVLCAIFFVKYHGYVLTHGVVFLSTALLYCIWPVGGDSCFNSRAHMCCGQPVRPLLLVGSSWPRFGPDCKHDSVYEETETHSMTNVSIKNKKKINLSTLKVDSSRFVFSSTEEDEVSKILDNDQKCSL